jgi:hypothetical protein
LRGRSGQRFGHSCRVEFSTVNDSIASLRLLDAKLWVPLALLALVLVTLWRRRRLPEAWPSVAPAWPCDSIDKVCIAGTDAAMGCSVTPTWMLEVRGALEPARVEQALTAVAARYPSLKTRVQRVDGAGRRLRYATDPAFRPGDLFELVEAPDEASLAAVDRAVKNRPLDPLREFPVTLTMVRTAPDACRLYFRQHHAIADGRAFIALLADFAAYLDGPPAAIEPVGRRGELEALGLSSWKRAAWTAAGFAALTRGMVRGAFRPVVPLQQNQSNDYRGDNDTVHLVLGEDALAAWQAARKKIGVSLNSLLTGALFAAHRRWHADRSLPVGRTRATLLMETRPRDRPFASFANHLASLAVEIDLAAGAETAAIARAVQAQVDAQRAANLPQKLQLAQRIVASGMSLAELHRLVFEQKRPGTNFDFSNLIMLEFPPLAGAGWEVEAVRITTPVMPRHGIGVTAIRYRGRVTFNFNFKSSAASREHTTQVSEAFRAELERA